MPGTLEKRASLQGATTGQRSPLAAVECPHWRPCFLPNGIRCGAPHVAAGAELDVVGVERHQLGHAQTGLDGERRQRRSRRPPQRDSSAVRKEIAASGTARRRRPPQHRRAAPRASIAVARYSRHPTAGSRDGILAARPARGLIHEYCRAAARSRPEQWHPSRRAAAREGIAHSLHRDLPVFMGISRT